MYEITCICHQQSLKIEGELQSSCGRTAGEPRATASCSRAAGEPQASELQSSCGRTADEIKAATDAGWVTGIRDQLLRPKEVDIYCCAECRDLDAAMVAHFRPSNYRGFVEMCGLDPDDLPGAIAAVKSGKCKVKRESLLLHYITWLIDNPDENERGRQHQLAVNEEKRSCDGDMVTWLVKRADRLKQTEQALREGRTPCV